MSVARLAAISPMQEYINVQLRARFVSNARVHAKSHKLCVFTRTRICARKYGVDEITRKNDIAFENKQVNTIGNWHRNQHRGSEEG